MGAASSIVSDEDRHEFESNHAIVKSRLEAYRSQRLALDPGDVELNNALYSLSQLCDHEEYRNLLASDEIDLPHQMLEIVELFLPKLPWDCDCDPVGHALVAIWYLARGRENRKRFGCKEYQLVSKIAPLIIAQDAKHKDYQYFFFSIIVNIVNASPTLSYLLSDEVGLLPFYIQQCYDLPDDTIAFRMLANIVGAIEKEKDFERLVDTQAYIPVLQRLVRVDVHIDWTKLDGKLEYWCLNFATRFARYSNSSKLFRELNVLPFFIDLLKAQSNAMEGLKAACLLAFVLGKEESVESSKSLLQQYPMVLDLLILVFKATLNQNEGPEADVLRSKRFVYGIIAMDSIVGAILRSSISDANKASMIECDVISPLLRTLQLFLDNAPELHYMDRYMLYGKGGGEDVTTAVYALDALLQLSFYFQTDEELRKFYLQPKYSHMISFLKASFDHPKIRSEIKQNISTLLRKLEFKNKDVSHVSSSSAQVRKHVMISYAWAVNKPHVISLSNKLRQLGYDVWRDEEGSTIVGPMSGDTDDVMADAIQHAQAVIICVSPQYKESINCRSEAKYCKARQLQSKDLDLIFVMMNENYTTRSEPYCVDGWLGFMIGTELWYPLWSDNVVDSTAQALAKILGDRAKAPAGVPMLLTSPLDGRSVVPDTSTPIKKEKNVQDAWNNIQGKNKTKYSQTVATLLDELGVEKAEDLQDIDDEQIDLIAMLLKPVPRKQFLSAMAR